MPDILKVVIHDPVTDTNSSISASGDLVVTLDGEKITGTHPSGSTSDGTIALASSDTWYSVPASAPTTDYIIVVTIENEAGTIRWSFNNGGTPSVTNGNIAPEHLAVKMASNNALYYGSSSAGDDVNYTVIEQS